MKVEREALPNDGMQLTGGATSYGNARFAHAASCERRLQLVPGVRRTARLKGRGSH